MISSDGVVKVLGKVLLFSVCDKEAIDIRKKNRLLHREAIPTSMVIMPYPTTVFSLH